MKYTTIYNTPCVFCGCIDFLEYTLDEKINEFIKDKNIIAINKRRSLNGYGFEAAEIIWVNSCKSCRYDGTQQTTYTICHRCNKHDMWNKKDG